MQNQILDAPIPLSFNNGSSFPENAKIIGYCLLGAGIIALSSGIWIVGILLLAFGLFICFTDYGVEFHPEKKEITEYTRYLGFISIKKKFSYEKWGFLSVVPLRVTTTMYSRSSNSTNVSENYFTICLFGKNYRSKKELIRMDNKSSAEKMAKALCSRIGLDYFEYDPQIIRNAFRK